MSKKMAPLSGFVQHGISPHATGMWRDPKGSINRDWQRPEYWQHVTRTLEHGFFDAMSIADLMVPELQRRDHYRTTCTGSASRANLLACSGENA